MLTHLETSLFPHAGRRLLPTTIVVVVSMLLGSVYSMGPRVARPSRAAGSRASATSRWDSSVVGREVANHETIGHEVADAAIGQTYVAEAAPGLSQPTAFVHGAEPFLAAIRPNPPPDGSWTPLALPPSPASRSHSVLPSFGRAPPRS